MAGIEKKDVLIIISLFSVAFLIRAVGVSNVCIYGDEWIYWIETNRILASNFAPRADVFDYSPPFLQYIGAGVTSLFGGDLNTLRMISVIFGSLTVPMLYLFGKAMYDRKTGLLAALFLCFSTYYCLYSRIYMLEALTLFFITTFLYFFWLSQRSEGRKSIIYATIAGAMMGLAIDAKYISFFLIPVVLAYVLWTKRFSFKALMDKRIILIFIFAFLFFLPLIICLYSTGVGFHGIYYYGIKQFEQKSTLTIRPVEAFSAGELLIRGVKKILVVLTSDTETLIPTMTVFFKFSAISLFLITHFSYLHNFIRFEKRGSFFIISSLTLSVLILVSARQLHYLIYLLPFYFVMLSHVAVKSLDSLRREDSYKNIFRIFIISLTVIVLFSSFITGVTSPYCNEGEYSWITIGVEYIKNDVAKSSYEGPIVVGSFM